MGWPKGTSGNPGGRPKARADLQELCRARTAEAVATLIRIMRQKTNPVAAKGAAEALLDRGWGRPEGAGSAVFNIASADGGTPAEIRVSFVPGREFPDEPRLIEDTRSPHLPNGRRSN